MFYFILCELTYSKVNYKTYIKISLPYIVTMSQEEMISYITELEKRNEQLKAELEETKAHLKRYTAPASSKKYYQEHKEEHKQRVREYKERTKYNNKYQPTEEQKKKWARTAYLNKKAKLEKEKLERENMEKQDV